MDRPSKIAFIDTETTGLSHLSRPWEIAVVLRESEPAPPPDLPQADQRFASVKVTETEYLRQVHYDYVTLPEGTDPEALVIGRFHERAVAFQKGADQFWALDKLGVDVGSGSEFAIARWLHKLLQGATLVGVGVHYDAEVLGRMFLRHGLDWQPWHYDIRDLKTMTRGFLLCQFEYEAAVDLDRDAYQWGSSDQLAAWMGVQPPTDEERHTALGDARWARRWFDAL